MSAISNNPASSASASLVVDANRNQVQSAAPSQAATAPQAVNHSLNQGESVQLETYQVKKGDTLWDIADLKLGDPMKWKQIHALNKEQIKNPDLIYPGQTLTLPKEIQVAPTPPPANIPSPVDTTPPPAAPTPPPVAEEPAPAPAPAEPTPAKPLPPVADPPAAADPAPSKPSGPLLRPPGELPFPVPKLPNVADPKPAPVAAEPTPAPTQPATPAEPTAPVDTPAQPAPIQTTPTSPPLSSIGEPSAKSTSGVGKAAIIGGVVGTVGTGATLIAMTRTAGNLGGYQTAQVVAKGVNGVIGKVGLSVPSGPALSRIIKKVGGPKVAGSVTAVTVGLAAAGVAAGGYYVYQKATSKEGTVASLQPEQTAKPTPSAPANVDANNAFGNVQPVVDGNAAPPAVDLSPLQEQLDSLLDDKKYMLFGAPNQPEEIRGTAVQIWEQGSVSDKVALAQTLVGKGQSEVLGRILTHQSIDPMMTTQVMSTPGFPVEQFMNDLSDNHAFVVLDKLATVSAQTGEPSSAKLLSQIAESYDGTFSDREKPFQQLRQQYQSTGVWAQLPANVTQQIDKLLK